MSAAPLLSVVVPTHNRRALLARCLSALGRQTWPAADFEVLVVADACEDDTDAVAAALAPRLPYPLRLLEHAARSAAATRNLGAAHARSQLLLFLDDDVIAEPRLVEAHLIGRTGGRDVVLGYSKPRLPHAPTWWQYDARLWWEDTYTEMRRPDHRFHYRDFFSGNVSLRAEVFHRAGSFDATLGARLEDYELGLRLLKAGARFRFAHDAVGHHCDDTDLPRWLRRIRDEGQADVEIARRHPELRVALFGDLTEPRSLPLRWARRLAMKEVRSGEVLARSVLRAAELCEISRLRYRWRQAIALVREYNYWRGVAAASGGTRALRALLQEGPPAPPMAADAPLIELGAGRPAPDRETLARASRSGARLAVDGTEVGEVPPQPGAEPLRLEHLERALREIVSRQFVPAFAVRVLKAAEEGRSC